MKPWPERCSDQGFPCVAGTGVDPVTPRFSGGPDGRAPKGSDQRKPAKMLVSGPFVVSAGSVPYRLVTPKVAPVWHGCGTKSGDRIGQVGELHLDPDAVPVSARHPAVEGWAFVVSD